MNNNNIKIGVLPIGILLTLIIGAFLAYNLLEGDKSYFLAGDTSHGHYQIELECESCHTGPFADQDKMQLACESCHAKELDKVSDTHPKKKFLDPRNANLLEKLDARYCVSCHKEHKPEITRNYGVTLASDFCFHCHQQIAEDRESHAGFEFNSCATSGCHNYHDNTMLYEKFLTKHLDEPDVKTEPTLPQRSGIKSWLKKHKLKKLPEADAPKFNDALLKFQDSDPAIWQSIHSKWQSSVHAKVNANCVDCHQSEENKESDSFIKADKNTDVHSYALKNVENCASCHKKQADSFLESKHGMRLAHNLSPMSTQLSRLKTDKSQDKTLSCNSCHDPHSVDVKSAAVDACLGCHQDEHSKAYQQSKHFALWQQEQAGDVEIGSGVSCASCHLPRIKKGKRVEVAHNQNQTLRPNTKMLRTVCMNCHGLEFSLASLADQNLIKNNFQGKPDKGHQSIELVKQRLQQKSSQSLKE